MLCQLSYRGTLGRGFYPGAHVTTLRPMCRPCVRRLRGPGERDSVSILLGMTPVAITLLVAAAVLVVVAEWPRLHRSAKPARPRSAPRRPRRHRSRSAPNLEVVRPSREEFARSVERDLAALPTIDEHDVKR